MSLDLVESGTIDVSALNPSVNPAWMPNDWRDGLSRNEDAIAKLAFLTAFGGELPDHPKKGHLLYKKYHFGVKVEVPDRSRWRGARSSEIDAKKLRKKWKEVADLAEEIGKRKAKKREERKERTRENQRRRDVLYDRFGFGNTNLGYARTVTGELNGFEVEAKVGGAPELGVNDLRFGGIEFDRMLEILEVLQENDDPSLTLDGIELEI